MSGNNQKIWFHFEFELTGHSDNASGLPENTDNASGLHENSDNASGLPENADNACSLPTHTVIAFGIYEHADNSSWEKASRIPLTIISKLVIQARYNDKYKFEKYKIYCMSSII